MERQEICIPLIILEWSEWTSWEALRINYHKQGYIPIPNQSGVYEVKYKQSEERLTIGKASNLRQRIRQALVKGKGKHSTGARIRASEDLQGLVIRWAVIDRPAAVEESLHLEYLAKFGKMPRFTLSTK